MDDLERHGLGLVLDGPQPQHADPGVGRIVGKLVAVRGIDPDLMVENILLTVKTIPAARGRNLE